MAKETGFPQGREGIDTELDEIKRKCAKLEKGLKEARAAKKKLKDKNEKLVKKNRKLENKDIQEEYKDRFFKFIFGNPEHKKWTLSLYNAINGTQYTDEGMIRFNTIGDAVYMSMKNDISFLISSEMQVWEHQSTYNPNMPVRFFVYGGRLYDKYTKSTGFRKYSSRLQPLPRAVCICFYNGLKEQPEETVLRLSDACGGHSSYETEVRMLNINYGKNKRIMDACEPLREYAWLIDAIRRCQAQGWDLADAVDAAVDAMPDGFATKGFIVENRAEIKDMFLTEYNEKEERENLIEETREDMALAMLGGGKPIGEIVKYSRLAEERIRELALLNGMEVHEVDATEQKKSEDVALAMLRDGRPIGEIVKYSRLAEERIRELALLNGMEVHEVDATEQKKNEDRVLAMLAKGVPFEDIVEFGGLGEKDVRALATRHGISIIE